jgi:hypothetical protein
VAPEGMARARRRRQVAPPHTHYHQLFGSFYDCVSGMSGAGRRETKTPSAMLATRNIRSANCSLDSYCGSAHTVARHSLAIDMLSATTVLPGRRSPSSSAMRRSGR